MRKGRKVKKAPIPCPISGCGVKLTRSDYVKGHLIRIHSVKDPEKYLRHVVAKRRQFTLEEGGVPCSLGGCHSIVSSAWNLHRHLRTVHKIDNPPEEPEKGDGVCALCCAPVSNHEGGFLMSNFAGEVLEEYLPSKQVWEPLQSLSVCDKCLGKMDNVLREKLEVDEVEQKVRALQRELLHEMRNLNDRLQSFWREMLVLGDVVGVSGQDEDSVACKLRNAISSAAQDLGEFRTAMESKVRGDKTRRKPGEVQRVTVTSKRVANAPTASPEPTFSEETAADSEPVVEVKTEAASDAELHTDNDCDLSQPSATPPPPREPEGGIGEEEDDEEGAPEENSGESDWRESSKEESGDEEGFSDGGSEPEIESETEYNPYEVGGVKRKHVRSPAEQLKRKRGRLTARILEGSSADVNTHGWSVFKLKLYTKMLSYLRKRDSALKNASSSRTTKFAGIPDPRLQHCLEYDADSDTFSVGGVPVILHESTHTLECSSCHHLESRAASKGPTSVGYRMQLHIQSKHLSIFTCGECHAVLSCWIRYRDHVASHKGRFLCSDCGKSLCTEETLRAHRWNKHLTPEQKAEAVANGEKEPQARLHLKNGHFPCPNCGKVYTNYSAMHAHKRRAHQERPRLICTHCGQTFATKQNLHYHQTYSCAASGAQPPPQVPCDVKGCGRTFKTDRLLRRHFEISHSENAVLKPFRCEQCPAAFATKDLLNRHRLVHTDERPFECRKGCGITWKNRKHSARHERGCAGVKKDAPQTLAAPEIKQEII